MKWLKKIFKKNVSRETFYVKPLKFVKIDGVLYLEGLEEYEIKWRKITEEMNVLKLKMIDLLKNS